MLRRDDRGSRSLARPSTAPQPPEHPTKRRPQRIARHLNVRHQPPLVHAAIQPEIHAHAHKKEYLSLQRGPSPKPPPREHAPHPHRQPKLPTHAHAAPPLRLGMPAGHPLPRCPPAPSPLNQRQAQQLPPQVLTQPTGRARALMQNQRRHYHTRTHRWALSAATTPATHQPAPPNCHCREEYQVKWCRPGEPNARTFSRRTGIGPEKQTAGTGQRFGFRGVAGLAGLRFLLDGLFLLSRGTCSPSTSLSTSPPLEQKALVRLNEGTGGIENVKSDRGGTIDGRTCCANRMRSLTHRRRSSFTISLMTTRAAEPESRIILLRVCWCRSTDADVKAASIIATLSGNGGRRRCRGKTQQTGPPQGARNRGGQRPSAGGRPSLPCAARTHGHQSR